MTHSTTTDDTMGGNYHPTDLHADPVVVGLQSIPGVYYALCRACGAHTTIGSDPLVVARELQASVPTGTPALRDELPLASYAQTRARRDGAA